MAPPPPSPLLAVLLTVESYRGATLVYRWPPAPSLFKRHSRVTYWRGGGGDAASNAANGARGGRGPASDGAGGPHGAPASAWDMARDRAMREEQGGSATDTSASDDAFSGASDLDLDADFDADEGDADTDARSATDDGTGGGDDDASASSDVGAAPPPSSFRSRLGSSSLLAGPGSGGTRSRSRPAPLRDPTAVPPAADRAAASASRTRRARRAYDSYLGYEETFLAQLLSPRPDGCHRKFELVVDDIAFVGHPVCVGADGRWDTSAAPQADGPAAEEPSGPRGRAGAPRSAASRASSPAGAGRLSAAAPAGMTVGSSSASSSSSNGRGVSAFHLVLVLDRPDPTAGTPQLDISAWCRLYHDAVAFKLTAALWEEERRDAYVSRESARLAVLKETARDRGDTFKSYLATSLRTSSLARLMRALQTSLAQGTNAFVSVNDNIDAHLQLPPILRDPARLSRMREVETCLDFNDPLLAPGAGGRWAGSSDPWEEATRTTGPMLLPWKTLLVFGRGHERRPLGSSDQSSDEDGPEDDEEDSDGAREGGIEVWARRFTNLLKPTLSGIPTFAELADLLGWDLHDDVYPMVRHLIYYREARVVDVPRVHSTYAVSPLFDLGDLRFLAHGWHRSFPTLPSLPVFLAMLSASLRPFAVHFSRAERQTALDALVWLLRHDVVVQMHVRLRLIATEAVKRAAARKRAEERAARRERRILAEQRRVKRAQRRAAAVREMAHARAAADTRTAGTGLAASDGTAPRGRSREREATLLAAPQRSQLVDARDKSRVSSFAGSSDAHSPSTRVSNDRDTASATARSSELHFERRKVLRSRSPSMLFSRQTLGAGSLTAAPPSSSRPGTPRGRASSLRDGTAPGGLESSTSGTHAGNGLGAAHGAEPSRRRLSRSPSRARMRVTGFGDTEEVHLEDNANVQSGEPKQTSRQPQHFGTADAAATLLSRPRTISAPSSAEAPSLGSGSGGDSLLGSGGGGSSGARRSNLGIENLSDDARRLSLVGEDGEEDSRLEKAVIAPAELVEDVLSDDSRSSRAIDQDADDAEREEADSEVDEWEWDPVASIIAEPSRASGEENEWIAAMVEGHEAWLVNRLFSLLPYLNGRHTIDEIVYREEMRRRELRALLGAFKDDVLTFVHP